MLRREFGLGVLLLPLMQRAMGAPNSKKGPLLYLAARGRAQVFILAFGGARDESWLTAAVRDALLASSELWLEVGHEPGSDPDAASKREQLTHDSGGRTFFEVLEPDVRARAIAYCEKLGIEKKKIEPLRPWSAFYMINGAYWSQHSASFEQRYPDETLMKLAKEQGKSIRYEMPDQLAFARHMAAMPDAAQSQYIEFLLDFFDDQAAGRNQGEFGWIEGDTAVGERAVDRMRTRTPDLYRAMQVERNGWWTQTIGRLLAGDGTHFIGIGQMHVLGPDGIMKQLARRGISKLERVS